jgi:hypothetical protein
MSRLLERVVIVVVALAIAVGVIALLSGGLAGSRDDPGVSAGRSTPGTEYPYQGNAHLNAGQPRPRYNSDPPTSGAHRPVAIVRNGARISDDQLLQALSAGNVVFLYGATTAPAGLQAVADAVAPRFTPALAAAGQTVILGYQPGIRGIVAVAWTRLLRSNGAQDLRDFAQAWLGHGAPS